MEPKPLPSLGSKWKYICNDDIHWIIIKVISDVYEKSTGIKCVKIEVVDPGNYNELREWHLTGLNIDHWIDPHTCKGMKSIEEIIEKPYIKRTRLELCDVS